MGLKEDLKEKAGEAGFVLCGVSDIKRIEEAEFPPNRGLRRPSEVMPEAKSLVVMGYFICNEALNVEAIDRHSPRYICLYYEVTETRAWRLIRWLWEEKGVKARPTHSVHVKPAAMLAGLGFIGHNTQVITPDYGPRIGWVSVLTDTQLEPDTPFARDLCAEQPLCREKSLCVTACPYRAIIPGPSQGVPPGEKVKYEKCVVTHTRDEVMKTKWERFIRRISDQGFMACTLCNLACPYGRPAEGNAFEEEPT